jgi:small conductance mechanosensitive channel
MDKGLEKITDELPNLPGYLMEVVTNYGLKLLGALITLVVGLWVIKRLNRWLQRGMERRFVDPSLRSFLGSLLSVTLKISLIIAIISMIGVQMTSFVAILGAAGLAIGFSLQGTLSNFAGGVIILAFKPFRVNDFIEAQGFMGTVSEINIINTYLTTTDNKVVIIPNGALATGSLTNFNKKETRRVQWIFGISYGDDFDKAEAVILRLIQEDERILPDPPPFVALQELGNSSVNIVTRAWVNAPNFWPVFFDLNKKVYKTFKSEGLTIPFPQMDIHLHKT